MQYEYEGPFQVKRLGFSGVSVSLELVLPTQVKNRLEIPRLDGLELAEFRMESEVPYTLAANSNRHNWPQSGTREVPNQFTVVFSRDNEGDAPYGRLARANPHLLYVVRKEDIVRVRQVNLVCIAACLLAIFVPYALNGAVWSNIFSWLTMILILVDAYYKNPKSDPGASNQELRATASRPIKSILGVNVLSARGRGLHDKCRRLSHDARDQCDRSRPLPPYDLLPPYRGQAAKPAYPVPGTRKGVCDRTCRWIRTGADLTIVRRLVRGSVVVASHTCLASADPVGVMARVGAGRPRRPTVGRTLAPI
ncbi:hypothetical protein GCM10023238_33420 [Streptomyces heliomycini]